MGIANNYSAMYRMQLNTKLTMLSIAQKKPQMYKAISNFDHFLKHVSSTDSQE